MQKKTRILFIMLAAVVLSILTWAVLRPHEREPMYDGKPLSYWLSQMSRGPVNNSIPYGEAVFAVKQIGTNAIPTLLKMLRTHDSPLKIKVFTWLSQHSFGRIHYTNPEVVNYTAENVFANLQQQLASAVPELIIILDQNISPDSASLTAAALGFIGPEAHTAIPSLLQAVARTNEPVHHSAIWALGNIHAAPDTVVPVLTKWLSDPSGLVRMDAAIGLGKFQGDAKSAVPTLVTLLNELKASNSSRERSAVEQALQQIDPDTYAKVVTNAAGGEPGRLKAK